MSEKVVLCRHSLEKTLQSLSCVTVAKFVCQMEGKHVRVQLSTIHFSYVK